MEYELIANPEPLFWAVNGLLIAFLLGSA